MIGWEDVYKVVVAMAVVLILGYGSVKWWRIFTPEQCEAINRLVCYSTLSLFTLEFTSHVNPFKMNYLFIRADATSKVIIVTVLAVWAKCSSKGSYCWSITSFSLATLTNSLVVGVPLLKAMYGRMAVELLVQFSVIQAIVWLTILLFVLKIRRTENDFYSNNNNYTNALAFGDKKRKDLEENATAKTEDEAALPQSITSFIYVKEYGLHADVLSTDVIFGMIVSLPVLIGYYAVLEFVH